LARAERRLEPIARLSMIRILSKNPREDLRGFLDATLLEAEGAERDGHKRVVT